MVTGLVCISGTIVCIVDDSRWTCLVCPCYCRIEQVSAHFGLIISFIRSHIAIINPKQYHFGSKSALRLNVRYLTRRADAMKMRDASGAAGPSAAFTD